MSGEEDTSGDSGTSKSRLKIQRSSIKRKITLHIKALSQLIEQNGSKTRIRQFMQQLENCVTDVEKINIQYIATLPELEHEEAYKWYDVEFSRINEVLSEAATHLDLRESSGSVITGSLASETHLSRRPNVNSAKAKAKAAEVFAKKQKESVREKQREIENRIRLQNELLTAQKKTESVMFELEMQRVMSQEAEKTRELEAEAACLQAEAAELENTRYGVDELQERLREFDDFDPETTDIVLPPPEAFNTEREPVIDPLGYKVPGDSGRTFNLTPPEAFRIIGDKSVADKPDPKQPKELHPTFTSPVKHFDDDCKYAVDSLDNLKPTFDLPSSTPLKAENPPQRPRSRAESKPRVSWISQLVEQENDIVPTQTLCNPNNRNKSGFIRSSGGESLPKLKLDTFDGDPLRWPDWMSMFQSIIHEAEISMNAKMHHLQNSVTGRAKEAIEGYGYTGDSYVVALGKLESRFGKPDVVVKAHLNRLRRWSKLNEDRLQEVRHFSDAVSSATNTFKRLGYVEDLHAANNLNMVVDKLPSSLVVKWKEHKRDKGLSKASLVDFSCWVESQAEVHEELNLRSTRQPEVITRVRHSAHATVCSTTTRSTNNFTTARQGPSCIMGDMGPHKLFHCPKFKELTVQDRLNKVKEHNLCFRCLGKHWAKDCTSTKPCGVNNCTKLHNELLHKRPALSGHAGGPVDSSTPPSGSRSKEVSSSTQVGGSPKVLLQVIPVVISGPGGKCKTYALLDLGSTCSLILDELARSLHLSGKATSLDLHGIQTTSRLDTRRVSFSVGPDDGSESKFTVNNALAVKKLNLPPTNARLTEIRDLWRHLSDLDLQDLDGVQVEVVLGSDVTELIIPREVREGPKGSPLGVRTKLGWTVTGSVPGYTRQSESVYLTHVGSPDEVLNELVRSWWKVESFGCAYDSSEQRSREDEKVMRHLENTTKKVDGRYEVGLIWKDQDAVLPNNRLAAEKRLHSLEKRLEDNPDLSAKYKKTIENDLEKGYIRKLSEEEQSKTTNRDWYLPHHGVTHPNKPGKVRRVCDAAASYKGTSLNDHLSAGPDLLNSLVGILMRFRQEPIAISADIEAMFSQVAVPPEDQSALRFLWRNNPEDKVEVYQYVRHIFGAKSAPTCANYALRRTAQDNAQLFPAEAEVVLRNFYMDDLFKSVSTLAEASALQTRLVELLSRGGFRLTKWISNNKDLLKTIPVEERAQSVRTITDESHLPVAKALGVVWNVEQDKFEFKIEPKELGNTRRKIVSIIASLFDPIGFLAPFVLKAKMFLQRLWQLRQSWDDEIPSEFQDEWSKWQKGLENLEGFSVPRFYRTIDVQLTSVQLHVFGDASELAFCAVAYFRFEYSDGRQQCVFVGAKTRVAPVKPLSIPKLELQAAVLCARLATTVKKEHDYEVRSTWLWTDSSSVLGQIRGQTKRHPAFVANRLSEILDLSEPGQWRHCPGKLNPADDGSRGLEASAIDGNCRWLNGPAFLLLPEHQWPEDIPTTLEASFVSTSSEVVKNTAPIFDLSKYSSLTRVCRVTAWIKRFVKNCRSSKHLAGPLSVNELREAKQYWIKHTQNEVFGEEHKDLKCGKSLSTKSPLVTLTPFLDDSRVLRVGGRIGQADVAYDVKHPIIIPQGHHLCTLLILDVHNRLKHKGIEHVRNELRQVYWIPHSRSTVRRVLNNCAYCRRRRAKPQAPLMASLPKDRLTVSPPFTKVGVDYFGPLTIKHLRKQEKRYGCLFTCLVTRAVHLEVATSLETDSFINVLRRFIARRGNPTDIYSDNGTNFVGAERELKESLASLDQLEISDYLARRETQWHFNPPASPHCGGVWERLVQSCKKVLKVVLHGQVVTDDVLHTAMTETEALVNSRPLTEVSSDAEDLEAITPNHFLLSCANPVLPIGVFSDKEVSSRKRWRQVQAIVNRVWDRWLREYLPTLTERKKWYTPSREIKVGDLVLMVGEKTSRGDWPLARVINVFPGKDGTVRICEVKTKAGVLKRSIAKIALLEES